MIEISIVMPCLNEERTLRTCIVKAKEGLKKARVQGEIIVADNGSTDASVAIAHDEGAIVVLAPTKGYGSAVMAGIEQAKGTYIITGDADDSYDFSDITAIIEKLRMGYDLVIGNRFMGGIEPGAMSFLHKYVGNPALSKLAQILFWLPLQDLHSGMRGFKKEYITNLQLKKTGFEFTFEMILKASLRKNSMIEVPIKLYPTGRGRPSHLNTWKDGWRFLKFVIVYRVKTFFVKV